MYRKTLQTSVAAAALFAFTAAYSAPASAADDTFKTGSKASLTMSGQVNRAFLIADDGNDTEVFHVDNDNTSTRIRWIGKGEVTEKFSTGMLIEVQLESNSTTEVKIGEEESTFGPTSGFGERKMEAWLAYKGLGKLTLGQGDPASNGTAEITLSGTSVIMYPGIADTAGGIRFRSANLADGLDADGPSIGAVWGNQHDGRSRTDRIRYDSPKWQGFVASASHIQGGLWDVALRHSGKFGQFKTSAAIAFVDWSGVNAAAGSSGIKDEQINGSISVLHDSGLNVTFSGGTRDAIGLDVSGAKRNDDDHIYVMLGYIAKIFDVGTTRFGVDYGVANDINQNDDEITTWGIAVNQNLKDIGTDIYAVFRNHELDRTGEDFDDINIFMAGARVKF